MVLLLASALAEELHLCSRPPDVLAPRTSEDAGPTAVTVRVVDLDGRPLAGVEVELATFRTRTDADGRAAWSELEPGTWTLTVGTDGLARGRQTERVELRPDRSVAVELTLPPPPQRFERLVGPVLPSGGGALLHVSGDPARWERLRVTCRGERFAAVLPWDGEAWLIDVPTGARCRARWSGDSGRERVDFVGGQVL